jgi:hypothetical protein
VKIKNPKKKEDHKKKEKKVKGEGKKGKPKKEKGGKQDGELHKIFRGKKSRNKTHWLVTSMGW